MENKETGQELSSFNLTQVFCLEKEIEDLGQNIAAGKEILENLKKEVAQAKQSLRETEDKVKHEEIIRQKLHCQRISLEEQCEKLSKDIHEISATLQEKSDRLNKIKDELAVAEREKELVSKTRRLISRKKRVKAVVLAIVLIVVIVPFSIVLMDDVLEVPEPIATVILLIGVNICVIRWHFASR